MVIKTDWQEGDKVVFKKPHPCGGNVWTILRNGVDCKIQCDTCRREIIIPRIDLNKRMKSFIAKK